MTKLLFYYIFFEYELIEYCQILLPNWTLYRRKCCLMIIAGINGDLGQVRLAINWQLTVGKGGKADAGNSKL